MRIDDIENQREKAWFVTTITYITIGEAMPTKDDQTEFDQVKQLIYFVDDDGNQDEMTVYTPLTPDGHNIIPTDISGQRAVYKIKRLGSFLIGVLTDRVALPPKDKTVMTKGDRIAYGKTKCKIVEAAILSGHIVVETAADVVQWAEVIFEPRQGD